MEAGASAADPSGLHDLQAPFDALDAVAHPVHPDTHACGHLLYHGSSGFPESKEPRHIPDPSFPPIRPKPPPVGSTGDNVACLSKPRFRSSTVRCTDTLKKRNLCDN